jgi:2-polyprenyl-3-methyl-5-hydroxy-6-metoxy-1,4-benzoquinol methylase
VLVRFRKPRTAGEEHTADWYDRKFAETLTYHGPFQDSPYYFLWTVIADRLRGVKRVLEIGCGTGQLAALLIEQGVESYVGIDFSPKAIELARQAAPAGRFAVDDARTSNIYDEPHDALVCTEVLEHVPDDVSVVERFPPGTRCILSVPNHDSASHVRFFSDAEAVAERYGPYFESLDVLTLRTAGSREGHRIFLAEGERTS